MSPDLHTHSNVSDGTLSPVELVRRAAAAGVQVLALTDHDTTEGVPRFLAAARARGVRAVSGVELSVDVPGVVVHLLDRPAPSLPTEPGSAIVDATIRGVEGCTAMLDPDGDWCTPGDANGFRYHRPEHVTAWTPARLVADGEPVTL